MARVLEADDGTAKAAIDAHEPRGGVPLATPDVQFQHSAAPVRDAEAV